MDYKKIVIVKNPDYIDSADALIDQDEFLETITNLKRIKSEALKYVEDYIAHINGSKKLHKKEYSRKYTFSSLPYFHSELGLSGCSIIDTPHD